MADKPGFVERAEQRIDAAADSMQSHSNGVTGAERRMDQEAESQQAWAGPGIPAMTHGQWTGLWVGSLVGGLIGAIVFAAIGLIPFADIGVGWRVLITAAIGAVTGGTAGALYWGGRLPELTGEMVDDDGRPSVGTTPRNRSTDDRGR
jgi:hypothetical protein